MPRVKSLSTAEKALLFSEKISDSLTLDELYRETINEISKEITCDFVFIYLLTKENTYKRVSSNTKPAFPLRDEYKKNESWLTSFSGCDKREDLLELTNFKEGKYEINRLIAYPVNNKFRTFAIIGAICQNNINENLEDSNKFKLETYARIVSMAAVFKKQSEKLNFILETSKALRKENNEKQMFQIIADSLTNETSKFSACLVNLYDDIQKNLYGFVSAGLNYKRESSRIQLGKNIIGKAYNEGRQISRIDNTAFVYPEFAKKNGFKSMISIQLIDIEQKPYGVLSLFTKYPFQDNINDTSFLESIVGQASMHISSFINKRKIKKLEDVEHLISKIISLDKTLEEIIHIFLEESLKGLNGEIGFVSLYPKDSNEINAYQRAVINDQFKKVEIPEGLKLNDEGSLASWVYVNRKPYLFTSNSEIDKLSKNYQNLEGKKIKSEMLVPLLYQAEFIGIMVLSSSQKHAFNNEDLEFLESIAQKTAHVIQNKRFHDASLKLNKFKYDELEEDKIFKTTVKITNKILDTPFCCMWKLEHTDSEEKILKLFAVNGVELEVEEMNNLEMRESDGGLSWETINKKECSVFDNIHQPKAGLKHINFAKKHGLKSMISVPLIGNKDEILGVINACTKSNYNFFEHEKILMNNLGLRFSSALANARLRNEHENLLEKWVNRNTIANPGMIALTFVHDIGHYIHYLNSDLFLLDDFIPKNSKNYDSINDLLESAHSNSRLIRKSFESLVRIGKKVKTTKKPFELKVIIKQIELLFKRRFKTRKIKFNYRESGQEEILLNGFPNEIEQLLVNLTLNSIVALNLKPQGKKEINISASYYNDNENILNKQIKNWVKIEFKDNGIGIAPENINRVFDLDFSTKGEEGSGFGLSICKRIVETNHNGKIILDSVYGKNAIFIIYLPY